MHALRALPDAELLPPPLLEPPPEDLLPQAVRARTPLSATTPIVIERDMRNAFLLSKERESH